MSRTSSRFVVAFSSLAILAMLLTACGGAAAPATATAVPPTSAPSSGQPTAAATSAPAQSATSAPAQVKNPNTLSIGTISDPQSLDPAWAYDTASDEVVMNVYQTLLFPKKDSISQFVPLLATSWNISTDGMTYTFNIRQGVTFQDGETLTPQDVAYSLWRGMIQDRAGGPQWIMLQPFFGLNVQSFQTDVVQKQYGGNFATACQAVEKAVTFDNSANTVTMHLKQPYGPMLAILAGQWASVVSMPWVVKQGGWDGNCADAEKYHNPAANQDELFKVMNGTGPYQFVRWQPNQEVDLTRFNNYWQKQPLWSGGPSGPASIQNVSIKTIPEFGTRFAEFKTGALDIAYIDTQYISQVDPLVKETCNTSGQCQPTTNTNGTLTLYKGLPTVEQTTIFFNQQVNTTGGNPAELGSGKLDGNGVPPNFFSDINVRKAFNYCFDWNTYISQVYNGEAQQVYGPIIQGELGYNANQPHFTFDLTKCADAFKASTLKSASGASLWDTGFYLQYVYNTGNDQRKVAGQILAQDLLKVNPKFHLAVVDEPFPLLLSDEVAGKLPIFMIGWLEDYHDPNDWVVPYLGSGGAYSGSQGFPAALLKQTDALIAQAASESDQTKRAALYSQLQNIAYENALDIFVVQPLDRQYMQSWVKGFYYNPIYPGTAPTGLYFYALSK
jgi:peptide/nickel transport system substrate-binding protein